MRRLTLFAIVFIICGKLEISLCFENTESDFRLKDEVRDFADYLKQKQHVSNSRFDSVKRPRGDDGADYLEEYFENDKKHGDTEFESLLEDLVNNNKKDDGDLRYSKKKLSSKELLTSESSSYPRKLKSDVSTEHHHGMEEIVYIRRTDSDSNDPIPEMIEKLVNDQPVVSSTSDLQERAPDVDRQVESELKDDPNAISSSDGVCPVRNMTSYSQRTCSSGPEYEMQFHPTYSETLKGLMLDMLPKNDPSESKCDLSKLLGPKTGVEDRALCPFEMKISNPNPSRVPEYLYEAKCSCQIPNVPNTRGNRKLKCVEVKTTIPVLWLVSCNNGKKRYKQGWDVIAVACAPMEERKGDSIDIDFPE